MLTVGILKEIRNSELRVGLCPEGVKELTDGGIPVLVEVGAGESSGFNDSLFAEAGATIVPSPEKLIQNAQLIVKVQAPSPVEAELLSPEHLVFSFMNIQHNNERLKMLIDSQTIYLGAEHVEDDHNGYPVLEAMSEISARMAIHVAANLLTAGGGGKGIMLSQVHNAPPANVTIIGSGMVGRIAALHAWSNGACVTLLSLKPEKIENYDLLRDGLFVEPFSPEKLDHLLPNTDVLIISVFSLKQQKEELRIGKDKILLMRPGSVLIDLSLEQNAIVETSHLTNISQPTYAVNGIIHHCLPNIASIVPVTATRVFTRQVLPLVKTLAGEGLKKALDRSPGILAALLLYKGKVTNRIIADRFGYKFYNIFDLLELNL